MSKLVRLEVVLEVDEDAADDDQLLTEILSDTLVELGPLQGVHSITPLGSEVEKILVLSTAHMPPPGSDEIENSGIDWDHYETLYGWQVPVLGEPYYDDEPQWLRDIIAVARRVDASYILFDRDAMVVDYLPTWEW